jgi:hypothetical protein
MTQDAILGTSTSEMDYSRFGAANPRPCPVALPCLGCFASKLTQNRHPERSAPQIYRVISAWWRGVEGPLRCLSYPRCSELFNHRAHLAGPPRSFPGAENQELASILLCPALTSTFSAAIQARCTLLSMQHKEGTWEGFTATYGCKRLLYFEGYEDIRTAIARENKLKGWRRSKSSEQHG